MKVQWESCDFSYKCPSYPYLCDRCWKGKVHILYGIRLNLAINNHPRTIFITLLHEFLEFVFLKLRLRPFHTFLDKIDKGKEEKTSEAVEILKWMK